MDFGQLLHREVAAVQVADPAVIVWQLANDVAFEGRLDIRDQRVDQARMLGVERLDRRVLADRRTELGAQYIEPGADLELFRIEELRQPETRCLALVENGQCRLVDRLGNGGLGH